MYKETPSNHIDVINGKIQPLLNSLRNFPERDHAEINDIIDLVTGLGFKLKLEVGIEAFTEGNIEATLEDALKYGYIQENALFLNIPTNGIHNETSQSHLFVARNPREGPKLRFRISKEIQMSFDPRYVYSLTAV